MNNFFLRSGFLGLLLFFSLPGFIYRLTNFDIYIYVKDKFELTGTLHVLFVIFTFILIANTYYFIFKCIKHFWEKDYKAIIKIIIIVFSIIFFGIPILIYYVRYMENLNMLTKE